MLGLGGWAFTGQNRRLLRTCSMYSLWAFGNEVILDNKADLHDDYRGFGSNEGSAYPIVGFFGFRYFG